MLTSKKWFLVLCGGILALVVICTLVMLVSQKALPRLRELVEQIQILEKREPLLGQIGGGVLTCSIQEGYAYVGVGHHLVILDIHNPAEPFVTGQTSVLPSIVDNILIRDNYAFVANKQGGVHLVNLSDPKAPIDETLKALIDDASAMTLAGRYAYIIVRDSLEIIDISDLTQPIRVGSFTPSHNNLHELENIVVSGEYAYITDYFNGLLIVRVADPVRPVEVSSYNLDSVVDLAIRDDYLYALVDGKLEIISISNPLLPTRIFTYDSISWSDDIAIVGEYAYLADATDQQSNNGLRVLDISDPTKVVEVGFYETVDKPEKISVSENLACLVINTGWGNSAESYLQIIDITNPEKPTRLGQYKPLALSAQAIALANQYIYLVDTQGNLHIIDAATPETPRDVGFYHVAKDVSDVTVYSHYAYVAGKLGLYVLDIADPAKITQVAVYPMADRADHIVLAGNNAYLIGDGLLQIIDVANPLAPSLIGSYDLHGATGQLVVADGIVYLAGGKTGLRIFDVTNPANVFEVGHFDMNAADVVIVDRSVYVTSDDFGSGVSGGLHIIDVSNPASPIEKGIFSDGGPTGNTFVSENYAYIAASGNGLTVFNISAPAFFPFAGFYSPLARNDVNDVIVSGDNIYLADSVYGLYILNKMAIVR
ncbi:MAG: hypothetical protein CVU44_00115 [Chloroflexi bacterium HGW-Chloroflexi-6]|nr:MAG: hypothetical protein CVU44_00115 [Chloroflexi bacterium HGW-Chloroflexi-6]